MGRIFWVGAFPPDVHSLGDHSQAYAVERWLRQEFPGYEIHRFFRSDILRFFQILNTVDGKEDYVFINSSGDFGDLYMGRPHPEIPYYGRYGYWHNVRRVILRVLRHVRLVQLPVTVYYSDLENIKEDRAILNRLPNFILCARDEGSYSILQESFDCNTLLVPDFCFYGPPPFVQVARTNRALIVFRGDYEATLSDAGRDLICNSLEALTDGLSFRDKDVNYSDCDVPDDAREKILANLLELYASHSLVVTDRFHGIVFSSLTGTACVGLPSKIRHKITGVRKFVPPSIQIVNSIDEVSEAVHRAIKSETTPINLMPYFDNLKREITSLGP